MGSAASKQGQRSPAFNTHTPEAIPSSRPQSRAHQGNIQGTPRQTTPSTKSSRSLSLLSLDEDSQDNMVCESCSANFTIFKRKNRCLDCTKLFCTNCFCKGPHRCCKTCLLFNGSKDRSQLMQFKVKDLRQYLAVRDIPTMGCREKSDLVDLVVQYLATKNGSTFVVTVNNLDDVPDTVPTATAQPRPSQPSETASSMRKPAPSGPQKQTSDNVRQTNSATAETANAVPQTGQERPADSQRISDMNITRNTWTEVSNTGGSEAEQSPVTNFVSPKVEQKTEEEPEKQAQPRHRASISDLKTIEDVSTLSVRQLKEILTVNFVNYKGCVERWELEDRVKRLYTEKMELKSKEQAAASATYEHTGTTDEDSICKICMDLPIDCVLLECGHMVTCTKCGKQLAECPLCRQYIVRAVHVFRS